MDFAGDSAAGLRGDLQAFLEGDLRSDSSGDYQSDLPPDSDRNSQFDLRRDLQGDLERDFRGDFDGTFWAMFDSRHLRILRLTLSASALLASSISLVPSDFDRDLPFVGRARHRRFPKSGTAPKGGSVSCRAGL